MQAVYALLLLLGNNVAGSYVAMPLPPSVASTPPCLHLRLCAGNETRLTQCVAPTDTFPTSNNCGHSEDIAVYCRPRGSQWGRCSVSLTR